MSCGWQFSMLSIFGYMYAYEIVLIAWQMSTCHVVYNSVLKTTFARDTAYALTMVQLHFHSSFITTINGRIMTTAKFDRNNRIDKHHGGSCHSDSDLYNDVRKCYLFIQNYFIKIEDISIKLTKVYLRVIANQDALLWKLPTYHVRWVLRSAVPGVRVPRLSRLGGDGPASHDQLH